MNNSFLCLRLLYDQVSSLQEALGKRDASRNQLILHQQTFYGEFTLLQYHLGCGPGLTEVPLHTSWEEISLVHYLVMEYLPQQQLYLTLSSLGDFKSHISIHVSHLRQPPSSAMTSRCLGWRS